MPNAAIKILAAGAILVLCSCGGRQPEVAEADQPPDGQSEPTGQPLVGLWADYFTSLAVSEETWGTAIPVVLRNVADEPITVRRLEFDEVAGLVVGEWRMVGPLDPSIATAMFEGWLQPTQSIPGFPAALPERAAPVDGFVIDPASAAANDLPAGADLPNDASPLVQLRRERGVDVGSAKGVTVHFEIDGESGSARFPDAQVLMCSPETFSRGRCRPDGM